MVVVAVDEGPGCSVGGVVLDAAEGEGAASPSEGWPPVEPHAAPSRLAAIRIDRNRTRSVDHTKPGKRRHRCWGTLFP